MKLIVIAACDARLAIGKDGDLAFKDKDDLRHFSQTTMGHTLIMGRKTYDSLPFKLKGRDIVVVSQSLDQEQKANRPVRGEQVVWTDNLSQAIEQASAFEAAKENPTVFIAGGGQIYSEFLQHTVYESKLTSILLTVNDSIKTEGADAFFPKLGRHWVRKSQKSLNNDCVLYEFVRG